MVYGVWCMCKGKVYRAMASSMSCALLYPHCPLGAEWKSFYMDAS